MANKNVYKFEIIEKIIMARDFETKEEVVQLAKKMKDIALDNDDYSEDVKQAFRDAYKEIKDELSLSNLKEIKKIITFNNNNFSIKIKRNKRITFNFQLIIYKNDLMKCIWKIIFCNCIFICKI